LPASKNSPSGTPLSFTTRVIIARMTALSSTIRTLKPWEGSELGLGALRPDGQGTRGDIHDDGPRRLQAAGVVGMEEHVVLPEQLAQHEQVPLADLELVGFLARGARRAAGDLDEEALLPRPEPVALLKSSGTPVSTNIAGSCAAFAASTDDCGSITCSMPATCATGS
jgi:hypothetical protein